MHLATTRDSLLPVFFNVDTSVGKGGQNTSQEDILLVQFLIQATAEASTPAKSAGDDAVRQRAANLPATGIADAATTDCIRAWQEARKSGRSATIVDGRVNPARGIFYVNNAEWTIVDLNAVFRKSFPRLWPRLHDHPKCPAALKARMSQVL